MTEKSNRLRQSRTLEVVLFAMLGAIMFCTKLVMQSLPNIHLVGMLIMVYTLVFRKKALIPIYIYVILEGIVYGFTMWWVPYLYVWAVLWGITMILPKKMPAPVKWIVYPVVCGLHGLLFGTLFAPAMALMMKMNFKSMIAWIVSGFPFDVIHGISNFAAGFLIIPLAEVMKKLRRNGAS